MDFRLNDEEESFRRRVRDWLVANLPAGWGEPGFPKPEDPAEKVAFARRWQRKLQAPLLPLPNVQRELLDKPRPPCQRRRQKRRLP